MSKCQICNGTGKTHCTECRGGKCQICDGYGTINKGVYTPGGSEGGKITCPKCGGSGRCTYCGGTGGIAVCNACNGTGSW